MSNNEIPRKYRVNSDGVPLDMRSEWIRAVFVGIVVTGLSVSLGDYLYDRCGYVGSFIHKDCSISSEEEQEQAVSVVHPSLVVK